MRRIVGWKKMKENDALMKWEITGETHLEDLVQLIEDCIKNVALKNPYTPAQTVLIGFNIIDKCRFYSDDCLDWRRKANLEKPGLTLKFTLQDPSKRQETKKRPPEIAAMRILWAKCRVTCRQLQMEMYKTLQIMQTIQLQIRMQPKHRKSR